MEHPSEDAGTDRAPRRRFGRRGRDESSDGSTASDASKTKGFAILRDARRRPESTVRVSRNRRDGRGRNCAFAGNEAGNQTNEDLADATEGAFICTPGSQPFTDSSQIKAAFTAPISAVISHSGTTLEAFEHEVCLGHGPVHLSGMPYIQTKTGGGTFFLNHSKRSSQRCPIGFRRSLFSMVSALRFSKG